MTPDELAAWRLNLITNFYPWAQNPEDRVQIQLGCGYAKIAHLYTAANKAGVTAQRGKSGSGKRMEAAYTPERLLEREQLAQGFTKRDDEYLKANFFDKRPLEEIAFICGRTESAMMYRARHLGLRKFCKYWPLEKAVGWMGMSEDELVSHGMLVYPCTDQTGTLRITLVSTSSLGRIAQDPVLRALLGAADADEYFLAELDEHWQALQDDTLVCEASRWVSHSHTCINPRSGEVFECAYNGSDMRVRNLNVLPSYITVGASSWQTPLKDLVEVYEADDEDHAQRGAAAVKS